MIYDLVSLDTLVHTVKTSTENYNYDIPTHILMLGFQPVHVISLNQCSTTYFYVQRVSVKHESK